MTDNMLQILERMYRSDPQAGYAKYKTALALERAGLVATQQDSANPARVQRHDFPHYWSILTDAGKALCQERFGPA